MIHMGTQTLGKKQVRYYREPGWKWTCWCFLVNGEGKDVLLGSIRRTENPRRYNGFKLKADAALKLMAIRSQLDYS